MGPKEEIQLLNEALLDTVEAETVEEPRMFHGQPMVRISGKGLVHLLALRRSTAQTAAGRA